MSVDSFASKTILVADDDDHIRSIVSEALAALGVTIVTAKDGMQAKEIVDTVAIDVAVLDISMPGFTGIEICAHIKSTATGELVPVVLLTAKDSLEDKVLGLESGADEYLTKPFQYRELQARVKACLRIRDLNLKLKSQSDELRALQEQLVEKERQLVAGQIGGTAAHKLGQPLSAMLLHMHFIEQNPSADPRFQQACSAIKEDMKRMGELLEKLRTVDASQSEPYFQGTSILSMADAEGDPTE